MEPAEVVFDIPLYILRNFEWARVFCLPGGRLLSRTAGRAGEVSINSCCGKRALPACMPIATIENMTCLIYVYRVPAAMLGCINPTMTVPPVGKRNGSYCARKTRREHSLPAAELRRLVASDMMMHNSTCGILWRHCTKLHRIKWKTALPESSKHNVTIDCSTTRLALPDAHGAGTVPARRPLSSTRGPSCA